MCRRVWSLDSEKEEVVGVRLGSDLRQGRRRLDEYLKSGTRDRGTRVVPLWWSGRIHYHCRGKVGVVGCVFGLVRNSVFSRRRYRSKVTVVTKGGESPVTGQRLELGSGKGVGRSREGRRGRGPLRSEGLWETRDDGQPEQGDNRGDGSLGSEGSE